ncbi:MAG: YicC family protein [Candidatus Kapabacteria bacterium]|nr:YicC family protein [Candidatus Kapabacteria bacterium]
MIRSMTGFGRADAMILDVPSTIEVRCVNGRYLEVSTKVPREWSDKESLIREVVRGHVTRGSITVTIRRDEKTNSRAAKANVEVAASYLTALRQIQEQLHLPGTISIELLANLPDIFSPPEEAADDDTLWADLSASLRRALEALTAMRDREGAELARDLRERLAVIERGLESIEATASERVAAERVRLRERVAQIMGEAGVDEQRLALEIVLLSEKLDVTEECVRLRSHIKHMRQYMDSPEHAGRKLNFLLQEMNREVNTIGSKSNHAEVAVIVVGMKEELERMREQVQNVE